MRKRLGRLAGRFLLALFVAWPLASASGQAPPRVFALRGESLVRAKKLVRARDVNVMPALDRLRRDAGVALAAPLVAVTDKHTLLPPSGDKHDYYSLSPYWWPDSTKPNGLPYMRKDGVTNPESKADLDQPRVAALGEHVQALALAYYLTAEEKYASRATQQIRTWFLDSATRMTPHLRFSQLIRGRDQVRGTGIIDTRWFSEVIDAIGLLAGSKSWSESDQTRMTRWFTEYQQWLRTSPNGKLEHDAKNNHGSWYAAQAATLAMFVGDTTTARELVNETRERIGWQITNTGEQPLEMERTKSLHYSGFNIEALSRVAEIGRLLDIDLWHYEAPAGGSLRKAIDHLAKFLRDPKSWPGQQITPVEWQDPVMALRRAQTVFGASPYRGLLNALPADVARSDRSALLYP